MRSIVPVLVALAGFAMVGSAQATTRVAPPGTPTMVAAPVQLVQDENRVHRSYDRRPQNDLRRRMEMHRRLEMRRRAEFRRRAEWRRRHEHH